MPHFGLLKLGSNPSELPEHKGFNHPHVMDRNHLVSYCQKYHYIRLERPVQLRTAVPLILKRTERDHHILALYNAIPAVDE